MIVYLDGKFLPEEQARVSIHDRGFLYGDGLFEAVRVYHGQPFLWEEHMERFQAGCNFLKIAPPLTSMEMRRVLVEVVRRNHMPEALVRVTLSRGTGPRGYSPRGAEHPTLCIAAYPVPGELPSFYRVMTSTLRLPDRDPLAAFKHANKLRQVVARAEADDAGVNEALLLNESGQVSEGTSTNLFWVEKETVCTPPLETILSGTTRNYLLKLCSALNLPTCQKNTSLHHLFKADGVFVTSCAIEVMEVAEIDGRRIKRSPITRKLKQNYRCLRMV